MNNLDIHKDFTLNGVSFDSAEDLLDHSKRFSASLFTFLTSWFDAHDHIAVNTSGSTGKPKSLHLKKIHMINSAEATGHFFELPANSRALLCLSTDFIAGKMMVVRALCLGWHLDIVEPISNPLKDIESNYDFSAMVPMQAFNSIEQLSQIKKLIIGGGLVSKELENKLQSVDAQVYATYGMTETCTHIAVKKLNRDRATNYSTLPGVSIKTDNRSCLVISAPALADEPVITNDIVEIISDTEFKWLGRYDTVINSGGIKLIPEQIEEKLSRVIKGRFFTAGLPDAVLGEKLVLIIEDEVHTNQSDSANILNELKELTTLTKYEVPSEIYFTSKFIETETKKIQRQQTLDSLFKNS